MHIKDVVDLRPSRPSVRLEKEDMKITSGIYKNRTLKVIYSADSIYF